MTVITRLFLILAGSQGAAAVALGAYAAHGMAGDYPETAIEMVETGSLYGLGHSAALLGLTLAHGRLGGALSRMVLVAGWCFGLGPLLFAGSLYAVALADLSGLGALAPIGGTTMILGWLALVAAGVLGAGRAQ